MPATLLPAVEQRWSCPNCTVRLVTRGEHRIPLHKCRGLVGLDAPFVLDGTEAKVEAVEREDYVGRDNPQLNGEGRPIMAIVTTREDGCDTAILAPVIDGGAWGGMSNDARIG